MLGACESACLSLNKEQWTDVLLGCTFTLFFALSVQRQGDSRIGMSHQFLHDFDRLFLRSLKRRQRQPERVPTDPFRNFRSFRRRAKVPHQG